MSTHNRWFFSKTKKNDVYSFNIYKIGFQGGGGLNETGVNTSRMLKF